MKKAYIELWRRLKEASHMLRTGSTVKEHELQIKLNKGDALQLGLRNFSNFKAQIQDHYDYYSVYRELPDGRRSASKSFPATRGKTAAVNTR